MAFEFRKVEIGPGPAIQRSAAGVEQVETEVEEARGDGMTVYEDVLLD